MKRRSFFGVSTETSAQGRSVPLMARLNTLAGMSLKYLYDRYRSDLFQEFLPFIEQHVIDHKYGGFMCNASVDGTTITTEKRAVYEGRGIWVYSYLYNNLTKEQKYLDIAGKSVAFLLKNVPEGDAMWPSSFTREGEPTTPPAQSVNADLYIADGLAEYAKATGDSTYREMARDITFKCLRVYDRPDYGIQAGRGYLGSDAPQTSGIRILDDWMLFLWVSTQMLIQKSDSELEALAARCVDTIMNKYYNPETGLISEILEHDHSRPSNEYAYIINFGNDFQALWHVMAEAVRLRDETLFIVAAERLKRHLEVAWDDVYGGLFNLLINVEENIWRLGKAHYVQVEPLVGLVLVMAYGDTDWASDWFSRIYGYLQEKFPLRQYGYPLWILFADRKVTFQKDKLTRIENFHQPRHLMLNLLMLEQMMEQNGKVKGFD